MLRIIILLCYYIGVIIATNSLPIHESSILFGADGAPGDLFGWSVATSVSIIIVGAPNQEKAYIFNCSNPFSCSQSWLYTTSSHSDQFGYSVAISPDAIVAVGGPYWNSAQGQAYIFNCINAANCVQTSSITAPDGEAYDEFGYSISISGNSYVTVGAPYWNNAQGKAYVFNCANPVSCIPIATLIANGGMPYSQFGFSVSISGNLIAIGAPYSNLGAGRGYLFDCTNPSDNTCPQTFLTPPSGNLFGYSISISGGNVAIGAPYNGEAFIYDCSNDNPTINGCGHVFTLVASNGAANDLFGYSVAIGDGLVVIGAPYQGQTYLYNCTDTTETCYEASILLGSDTAVTDRFGRSVAIYGNMIGLGSKGHNNLQGEAYVFLASMCLGEAVGAVSFPNTFVNNGAVGACASGVGEPYRFCYPNMTWGPVVGSCD